MDKEGYIDLERISGSVETLSSIENLVNLVNLDDNFEDIEKKFRQINFEHANCLSYKESLSQIYSDLEHIKRKVNELAEALRRTKANYTNINTFSDKDIKEFTQIYSSTPASEDLSKLVGKAAVKVGTKYTIPNLTAALPSPGTPPEMGNQNNQNNNQTYIPNNTPNNMYNNQNGNENVTTIPAPQPTEQTSNQPIDTIPIGIAIGATGIAGSIGAVIVDDMYRKKNKKKVRKSDIYIEDYNEDEIIDDESSYESVSRNYDPGIAQGPYRAARFQREADRFYGNQLQDLNLGKKDLEDPTIDDNDDDNYDNF